MKTAMKTVEIPVRGMDWPDCAAHVRSAAVSSGLALLDPSAFEAIPPLAAALQSLPDLGILANSSRLLRSSKSLRPTGKV